MREGLFVHTIEESPMSFSGEAEISITSIKSADHLERAKLVKIVGVLL